MNCGLRQRLTILREANAANAARAAANSAFRTRFASLHFTSLPSPRAVEAAYAIANDLDAPIDLSVQELVDCDDGDYGCSGGLMDYAFAWEEKEGGMCSDADYPYSSGDTHLQGECNDNQCESVEGSGLFDFVDVEANNPKALKRALARQPVSIAIEADNLGFRFYSSGVYNGRCGTMLDHGVLAVGYGKQEKPPQELQFPHPFRHDGEFWLVKNSWGTGWGDNGYIKLYRDDDAGPGMCGILMQASYPEMKSSEEIEEEQVVPDEDVPAEPEEIKTEEQVQYEYTVMR